MSHDKFTESGSTSFIWEITSNLLVASFFGFFAYVFAVQLLASFRINILLLFIKVTLDVSFYLCRKMPSWVSFRAVSWIMAIGGTITPLMLRPTGTIDSNVGKTIQCIGLFLQIVAIISLNRSYGIVPANRGIKINGMYRFVRHPLYSAYTIALLGFVISNPSLQNFCLLVLGTIFQVVRIVREEELLLDDPGYVSYTKLTKWKMIPFIY